MSATTSTTRTAGFPRIATRFTCPASGYRFIIPRSRTTTGSSRTGFRRHNAHTRGSGTEVSRLNNYRNSNGRAEKLPLGRRDVDRASALGDRAARRLAFGQRVRFHEIPAPRDDLDHARLPVGNHTDRKSTRLNSSHVKISYAV